MDTRIVLDQLKIRQEKIVLNAIELLPEDLRNEYHSIASAISAIKAAESKARRGPEEHSQTNRRLSIRHRICACLRQAGPLHYKEIAKRVGITGRRLSVVLSQNKDLFVPISRGTWDILPETT